MGGRATNAFRWILAFVAGIIGYAAVMRLYSLILFNNHDLKNIILLPESGFSLRIGAFYYLVVSILSAMNALWLISRIVPFEKRIVAVKWSTRAVFILGIIWIILSHLIFLGQFNFDDKRWEVALAYELRYMKINGIVINTLILIGSLAGSLIIFYSLKRKEKRNNFRLPDVLDIG